MVESRVASSTESSAGSMTGSSAESMGIQRDTDQQDAGPYLQRQLGQHAVLPLPARGARKVRGYRYASTQYSRQHSVLRTPHSVLNPASLPTCQPASSVSGYLTSRYRRGRSR